MKKIVLIVLILSITVFINQINAQETNRKKLNVTVYNSDLGVVREVREMNFKGGTELVHVTDVAQRIDPTSVHIDLKGQVLEQNYQYDLVSMGKILQKYIDKEVTLVGESVITGTLLSVNAGNIVLRNKDGGLTMLPKYDKYRVAVGSLPEGLITKPTLVWTVISDKKGSQDVELSYQTRGMGWHAEYVAVLNQKDTKMDLNSWVSVDNRSGATYNDAKLKLIAGDVNRVRDFAYEINSLDLQIRGGRAKSSEPQFEEKEFFEYHIYNLQRKTTIADNETKQISLFEADNVNINKKYLFKSSQYSGPNKKVSVVIEFENKKKNSLGLPMPKGKVRLYKSDGEGIEFIGEDRIDHTPRDEKITLKVGDAFDIVAEESELDHKKIAKNVYEKTYQVKIKNRKKEDIEVEVERFLGLNWEILDTTHKYEKKNARTIIFKAPVKEGKEESLQYKVRFSN